MDYAWDDYNIVLPARIISYDATTQTASVQVSAQRLVDSADRQEATTGRIPLEDVPVHTASGGGWAMTFPIKPGDTALLLFSQIGYDHWLWADQDSAGLVAGRAAPWLKRRFSQRDGLCLVGFNSIPRAVQDYSATDSQWRNSDATQKISLNDDASITIDTDVSLTVNAPSVVINCTTALVAAAATVTLDAPLTTVTGNLLVAGAIGGGGAAVPATGMEVTGPISATGDVSSGSHTLDTHIHAGDGGDNSGPDTGVPI